MTEERAERMSRATALGILARIAQKRKTTLDEVIALQMAVRCVAKRMFEWERHCKRKREEGCPATALPDADGAEAANGQTVQRPNGRRCGMTAAEVLAAERRIDAKVESVQRELFYAARSFRRLCERVDRLAMMALPPKVKSPEGEKVKTPESPEGGAS